VDAPHGSCGADKVIGSQLNKAPDRLPDYIGADQLRLHMKGDPSASTDVGMLNGAAEPLVIGVVGAEGARKVWIGVT